MSGNQLSISRSNGPDAVPAEAGACVVHNPISNLKLKSGAAPILDLYRAGVDIALGCDNCSCAESQNVFTAIAINIASVT